MSRAEERGGLFGTVARLQDGESTSGRQLSDGCREAGKLVASLKNMEDQVETLLTKIQDGHSVLADVRRSVASTETEVSRLSSNGNGGGAREDGGGGTGAVGGGGVTAGLPPASLALAEDLWCRPLREEVWGPEGVEVLEGSRGGGDDGRARADRAAGLVELMRDVYSQEKRLAHLRARIRDKHGGDPPFKVEWVSSAAES